MRILDITCLQRISYEKSAEFTPRLRMLQEAMHVMGVQTKCLILQQGERVLCFEEGLAGALEIEDLLHLDLAETEESLAIALLARFMVTHRVRYWCLPTDRDSLISASTLSKAAEQAGVSIGFWSEFKESPPTYSPSVPVTKPTLVVVAPLPPLKSGIADYVEKQLFLLDPYYQLVIVEATPQQAGETYSGLGQSITLESFLNTPKLHQRVLYHLGNSPVHLPAISALNQVPGLVVLHDFFLSDVQQYDDIIVQGAHQASYSHLIHAHGYQPLLKSSEAGERFNLSDYPCNLRVLEQAQKVLLHSDYVMRQALAWYGDRMNQRVGRIGFAKAISPPPDHLAAKAALGYKANDYLVATFGFATPAKCLEILVNAWATSDLSQNKNAWLLIAGEFLDQRYQSRIQRLLELRQCTNVRLLGYLDAQDYAQYLSAVDQAVQLRINSRGETSAALLDCLATGVSVIANHHGFVEDLPDHILWKLNPTPTVSELAAALDHLYSAHALREQQTHNALIHLAKVFDPQRTISQLVHEIEATAASGTCRTAEGIASLVATQESTYTAKQRLKIAQALQYNQPAGYNRQLLVDVTAIIRFDLRTGIQRVVRALLRELIMEPPEGYRVLPIYLNAEGVYRYGHHFMLETLGLQKECMQDQVVALHNGDLYLGVDLHTTTMVSHAAIYEEWRQRGVRIVNVLYDLLPIRSPQWFPAMVEPDFTAWARHIASNSDGVLAISRTVAEDFADWVREQGIDQERKAPLDIGWFHLGSDLAASVPSQGLPDDAREVLQKLESVPSFLMVGTIEPRKGHAQTLAAFDVLWAQGSSINLVIVGKEGWHMEDTAERLRHHPLLGQRLFWLEAISDEYLEQVYPRCTALIAASEGEGFGLPLIEAARHHIPVIARDIPVFREVGGDGAAYFSAETPAQLAHAIHAWLDMDQDSRPDVARIKCLSWKDSARQVLKFLRMDAAFSD